MARKTTKSKNLIGNLKQKPKRRKKRPTPKKENLVTKLILPSLAAAITCVVFYNNPKLVLPKQNQIKDVSFLTPLDFKTERKIKAKILEQYKTKNISELSKEIQNTFNFKQTQ